MDWLLALLDENGGLLASVLLGTIVVIVFVACLDRSHDAKPPRDEEHR